MSAARLIVRTGVAWVLSLALALAVVMGIHRALAGDVAGVAAAPTRTDGLVAASVGADPPRGSRSSTGPGPRIGR
jgi:hypothetical protein